MNQQHEQERNRTKNFYVSLISHFPQICTQFYVLYFISQNFLFEATDFPPY
jgi:hypothetical protein